MTKNRGERSLSVRVSERIEFLKTILPWIERLVSKHGRGLEYSQGSCHTHIVAELKDFAWFSFHTDTGQSMMGGNTFRVWYHPGRLFDNSACVLEVHYQVMVEESRVRLFDTKTDWQKKILGAKQNERAILGKMKREQETVRQREEKKMMGCRHESDLKEKAKNLGLM